MTPALRPGDYVVVDLRAYRARPPRRGEAVLARDPRQVDRVIIKRVSARHPDDTVELAGDNPAASTDSRHFGPVPARLVRGRILLRYYPLRAFRLL